MAVLKGTLDVLVLKALGVGGPMHGFEIIRWLDDQSRERVSVTDAALLQALHRMEEGTLIVAEWGLTEKGRKARYYRITPAGRARLRTESSALLEHLDA